MQKTCPNGAQPNPREKVNGRGDEDAARPGDVRICAVSYYALDSVL